MIQLTFQASLDPFHAMFRMLRLRSAVREGGKISTDHLRIVDFYLVFPFRIESIRLQPNHRKFKRLAVDYIHLKPYGEQPDDQVLFKHMAPMQLAAIETLAANKLINLELLRSYWIEFTAVEPPVELVSRIDSINELERSLLEFMKVLVSDYDVGGLNGLKHRTGLMEYRYDAV